MPVRQVELTEELDRFVANTVKAGRFRNADEVMQEALRTLEREEREDEAKMVALIEAIEEGEASGIYEGDPFADVRRKMGWETKA